MALNVRANKNISAQLDYGLEKIVLIIFTTISSQPKDINGLIREFNSIPIKNADVAIS
jgi:hypothetical protein